MADFRPLYAFYAAALMNGAWRLIITAGVRLFALSYLARLGNLYYRSRYRGDEKRSLVDHLR
jgi:hypothetical protein